MGCGLAETSLGYFSEGEFMYRSIILIILFIFINNTFAQFIQPSRIGLYDEVYTSSNISYGIGNIGFDTKLSSYNPNYFRFNNTFNATVIGNTNISSGREYSHKHNTDGIVKYSENKFDICPTIGLNYKLDDFLFSLDFTNDIFFSRNLEVVEFSLSTSSGTYLIRYDKPDLNISNNILQLSVAKKISESFSMAVGLLTNRFNYSLQNNSSIESALNDYEISSDLFSNFQFLFAINYNYKNRNAAYLLFKTQNTEVAMTPSEMNISNSIVIDNWSEINFPAIVGYGLQIGELEKIKFSLEMYHKMIFKENNVNVNTTTINLGANYNPIDPLYFGVLFSYPLKLKQSVKMNPAGYTWDYNYFLAEPSNRFNFSVTSTYAFQPIDLFIGYQYSKIASDNGIEVFKDYSSKLQIGISYNL